MQKKFIILRKPLRLLRPIAVLLFFLLLGPFAVLAFGDLDMRTHWRNASHASSGLAPALIKSRRLLFRFTAHARITGAVHSEYTPGSRQKAEQWTLHRLSGDRLESLSGATPW